MSDGAPWFFPALGLPAYADEVMVRRAYARLLRGVDPGADPMAFQRLRTAYEAARAWCASRVDEHALGTDRSPSKPLSDAHVSRSAAATDLAPDTGALPTADQAVDALARQLVADAASHPATAMDGWLASALASLRMRYIDAPGQLEDRVVDLMRHAAIAHRAALFESASEQFRWREVGRHVDGDVRRAWIERVMAQEETWRRFDATWRGTWLDVLSRACVGIDASVARQWPDIERLRGALPEWIILHIAPSQLDAWQAAFEALSQGTRDTMRAHAAPPSALRPAPSPEERRRQRRAVGWTIVLFVAVMLAGSLRMLFPLEKDGGEPLPHFNEPALTARQCAELYRQLDAPDAFSQLPATEVVQVKRRAHRCALDGHWSAPAP